MSTPPKLFSSYSHDSESHKGWVLQLCSRLVTNGVDVTLDQWDLSLGGNLPLFMEQGVTDTDRILAICTAKYVEKANKADGGVGYERMILTSQLMQNLESKRIIPIIRDNADAALPYFLAGRFYLDFRDDSNYEENYSKLVHEIHGVSIQPRPALGPNPFEGGASPNLAFSRERYVSPALIGSVTFDYSNNNGGFIVGSGELAFDTRWSRAGVNSIYAYSDGANIQSVALAVGAGSLDNLQDVSVFDPTSRIRNPSLGEIVIWRNHSGYYMATKIERISVRNGAHMKDELTFSYRIQPNRTPIFNEASQVDSIS